MKTALALLVLMASPAMATEPIITASKGIIAAVPTKTELLCEYQLAVTVKNNTKEAIDELSFYVRLKDPKRTVPHADTLIRVTIPSGIEPGETKAVAVKIPGSRLEVNLFEAEKKALPLEITIANKSSDGKQKLREVYAGNKFAAVPLEVQGSDPNVNTLLNLK